jgi:hypothetical protein
MGDKQYGMEITRRNGNDEENALYILWVIDNIIDEENPDIATVEGWYHLCMPMSEVGQKICKQLESQGFFNAEGLE